jgi:hypothetical protein
VKEGAPLWSFDRGGGALEHRGAPITWREALLRGGHFIKGKGKVKDTSKGKVKAKARGKGSKAS